MIALAVMFGGILLLALVYAAGVWHGFRAYQDEEWERRQGEWVEPGAAFDYQEPYRGKGEA